MDKFISILEKTSKIVFSSIMLIMLVILSMHVIMRYLFNSPIIWTDEVLTLMQGTIAFFGIGYCFHKNKHTELSLFYDRVPRHVQWIFDIITNSVMLFCMYKMLQPSFTYVSRQRISLGTIDWLHKSSFYIFIPIGFIIAIGYIFMRLFNVFKSIIKERRNN